jgi:hypothetical protein
MQENSSAITTLAGIGAIVSSLLISALKNSEQSYYNVQFTYNYAARQGMYLLKRWKILLFGF